MNPQALNTTNHHRFRETFEKKSAQNTNKDTIFCFAFDIKTYSEHDQQQFE